MPDSEISECAFDNGIREFVFDNGFSECVNEIEIMNESTDSILNLVSECSNVKMKTNENEPPADITTEDTEDSKIIKQQTYDMHSYAKQEVHTIHENMPVFRKRKRDPQTGSKT